MIFLESSIILKTSCPEAKRFRINLLWEQSNETGEKSGILAFSDRKPITFLLSFPLPFQRLLFCKQQSGETEEPVSLKTSHQVMNQPAWRLAHLWRCFLFVGSMAFCLVWCGCLLYWLKTYWRPRGGVSRSGSDGVCRWWAVKVVPGLAAERP